MARNRYLSRRAFTLFLAERVNRVVGKTRDIHECPVANFLGDVTRREWHTSALACVPQVNAEVEDHEFRTPKWAKEFIHNLDRHFGRRSRDVTGEEALYVLNEYS